MALRRTAIQLLRTGSMITFFPVLENIIAPSFYIKNDRFVISKNSDRLPLMAYCRHKVKDHNTYLQLIWYEAIKSEYGRLFAFLQPTPDRGHLSQNILLASCSNEFYCLLFHLF